LSLSTSSSDSLPEGQLLLRRSAYTEHRGGAKNRPQEPNLFSEFSFELPAAEHMAAVRREQKRQRDLPNAEPLMRAPLDERDTA
jgi:hypothetical protein